MKLKTRKAAIKRVNKKKRYFARGHAGKAHLLKKKSASRLRRLNSASRISTSDFHTYKKMVPAFL